MDTKWLEYPAPERQLAALAHYHRSLARDARKYHWTKSAVSAQISSLEWRPVLFSPPESNGVRDAGQEKPEPAE